MKILIIGGGYVGKRCKEAWGEEAVLATEKVYTPEDVLQMLAEHEPDVVLNAAGVRGKPNVDWCEAHQLETIVGNTKLPITIAEACQQKNIYLLHIGSGCVFYGESPDPKGWKEDDFANPVAVYSKAKYAADITLSTLSNVGIARIRMPMDYISSPFNIIDKLAVYEKIADVENSLTVIEDMVKVFYQLLQKEASGIFHVTNPGTIKHREIIELYKKYVDPTKEAEWISANDLVDQGLVDRMRSTNKLQSHNLEKLGITMRDAKEAVEETIQKYAALKRMS
jgi:dTDP-4-dehydrorhamnose reductase